jgi:hypothetical protein
MTDKPLSETSEYILRDLKSTVDKIRTRKSRIAVLQSEITYLETLSYALREKLRGARFEERKNLGKILPTK